ncbi:MAG: hypothetical protein D6707_01385 [Bacteroidetes bacterium]|nr:MAG: hypothetical protein D6707_01385 [Bacteroidota bacterium]
MLKDVRFCVPKVALAAEGRRAPVTIFGRTQFALRYHTALASVRKVPTAKASVVSQQRLKMFIRIHSVNPINWGQYWRVFECLSPDPDGLN